jgi:hypothetical protein
MPREFKTYLSGLSFNSPRVPSINRIGPHNYEVLTIINGSLLGSGVMEKSKDGYIFSFHQKGEHLEYLL